MAPVTLDDRASRFVHRTGTMALETESENTMSLRQNLLFVDNDPDVLHTIRRELFDAPFNVLLAESGGEAAEIMDRLPVEILVCDIRMTDTDGLAFLEKVRQNHPDITRILLSGEMNDRLMLSAITRGLAGSFFSKPLEPLRFREDCQQILISRRILRDPDLLRWINSIGALPSPPRMYREFMAALEQDKGTRQLAEILEKDAALAVNILRMANAACYSSYPITSLERALIQLGNNIVKNTVLTLSLADHFSWNQSQEMEIKALMNHSSLVSRLTALFFHQLQQRHLDELANTAALTHDIGKILLLYFSPERYFQVTDLMKNERGVSFREAEIRLFQNHITHCELGAFLLSQWCLPSANIDAALFHHSPQAVTGSNARLIHIIALANLRAALPASISGEEWLETTEETPFTVHERQQLWEHHQFKELMETGAD